MSEPFEIPDFLRRTIPPLKLCHPTSVTTTIYNRKGNTMNTHTPAKAPKKKRQDAYVVRATIQIILNPKDPNSYSTAVIAMDKLEEHLPAGSKVTFSARGLGKV